MTAALRALSPEEQAHLDRLVARTRKPRSTQNAWMHIYREATKAGLDRHLSKIVTADIKRANKERNK
jgi:hypothetical protein